MFNIKISPNLKLKLMKLINSIGGVERFAKSKELNKNTIKNWLRGNNSFPFEILEEISKLENENILDLLDDEIITYERSQHKFRFHKNISLFEVNLLGWILSEGHLEKGGRIIISQKNKICLINIKNKLKNILGIDSTIEKDRKAWKLKITNAAFSNYLRWRHELKKGKKHNTIRVPKLIFKLDDNYKFSFLAGFLEGDGSFHCHWRKNKRTKYKVPLLSITSSSKEGIKDLQMLYRVLNIPSKIYIDRKSPFNSKWNDTFKLQIFKFGDCIKLSYYIIPYLLHPERRIKLKEIFKDKEILNCIRVSNNKPFIELVDYLNLERKEIPIYLKNNLKYKTFVSTVNGWINGYYKLPLSVFLHSCDVLKKDYFEEDLPEEFSFLIDNLNES